MPMSTVTRAPACNGHTTHWDSLTEQSNELWSRFRASLGKRLERTSSERFELAWQSRSNRTSFILTELLPNVAADLELTPRSELFKVDMAMGRSDPSCFVPIVWIESENDVSSIDHEVRKLAALSGPLKVLFACCEWDSTPGVYVHGGAQRQCLAEWSNVLRSHGEAWPSHAVFAVVVAEWNEHLRFFVTAFDGMGTCIDVHDVLFERPMAVGPAQLTDATTSMIQASAR